MFDFICKNKITMISCAAALLLCSLFYFVPVYADSVLTTTIPLSDGNSIVLQYSDTYYPSYTQKDNYGADYNVFDITIPFYFVFNGNFHSGYLNGLLSQKLVFNFTNNSGSSHQIESFSFQSASDNFDLYISYSYDTFIGLFNDYYCYTGSNYKVYLGDFHLVVHSSSSNTSGVNSLHLAISPTSTTINSVTFGTSHGLGMIDIIRSAIDGSSDIDSINNSLALLDSKLSKIDLNTDTLESLLGQSNANTTNTVARLNTIRDKLNDLYDTVSQYIVSIDTNVNSILGTVTHIHTLLESINTRLISWQSTYLDSYKLDLNQLNTNVAAIRAFLEKNENPAQQAANNIHDAAGSIEQLAEDFNFAKPDSNNVVNQVDNYLTDYDADLISGAMFFLDNAWVLLFLGFVLAVGILSYILFGGN